VRAQPQTQTQAQAQAQGAQAPRTERTPEPGPPPSSVQARAAEAKPVDRGPAGERPSERKLAEERERAAAGATSGSASTSATPAASPPPAAKDKDKPSGHEKSAVASVRAPQRVGAFGMQRINTPTSVDPVDVPVSSARPLVLDPDPDGSEATVEIMPVGKPKDGAGAISSSVLSAVPSTAPQAMPPDKERPRAETGLDAFLAMAVAARASDLHLVAGRPALLRIATDLLPRSSVVAPDVVERIAREIVPPRLRETLEADGSCDFAFEHPLHGRFRVNVSRQRTGFKVSMRVVAREAPTLASLGLPVAVAAATTYPQGLVLVTGPMNSGKTSTLAALVDQLNREKAHHILTVEDPVEFVHARRRALVSQREVGTHTRSLASGLRAALREDADVVVIGELRDRDAIQGALVASQTGRLVLATMSTQGATKTVDRLIDLFSKAEQPGVRALVARSLRMIIGQRLVPSADRTRLHAAIEILPSSVALYTAIRDGRTNQIPSLQQRGRANGVLRLDESLADLVRSQKATLEVAKHFAESPADLEALVARGAGPSAPRKG